MNRADTLARVLDKYKLSHPIPAELQQGMMKAQKRSLVEILKKNKKYSLFSMMSLGLYFWLRRSGIGISLAKCMIITSLASLAAASFLIGGTYYALQHISSMNQKPLESPAPSVPKTALPASEDVHPPNDRGEQKEEKAAAPAVTIIPLGFKPLTASAADSDIASPLTKTLLKELRKLKGRKNVILLKGGEGKEKVQMMLLGSLSRRGEEYRVSARLIDTESSEVLYSFTEGLNKKEQMGELCRDMAEKIAGNLK